MISILIPTYNYNVTALFASLKTDLESFTSAYEIICYEDGSTKNVEANSKIINSVAYAKHIISQDNMGRHSTRQSLAKMAKFEWLLFLDADVIPKETYFLNTYLKFTNSSYQAIYGGCSYDNKKPDQQYILRWKYGMTYENIDAKTRNKNVYKVVVSANFMIKKNVFLDMYSHIENDGYGYDNIVAAFMKSNNTKIFHINNNVVHKGLDENTVFLNKTEKAVETIFEFNKKNSTTVTENTLLEFFRKVNSVGLSRLIIFVFNRSKTSIRKQLLSNNPNLTLFQFYKLGYLCSLTSSKK